MRPRALMMMALCLAIRLHAQQPFTLQQILSAPYASSLTAAPVGNLFAWVEDAEGRHNLYMGGPDQPARQLTHNTEDDGQDISQLAWAPDATAIACTYGAPSGADGKPANPAHLQRATPVQVIVQPIAPDAKPIVIGDGRSPLFARDGKTLLFLRGGQIWAADFAGSTPVHQLVFDRGSASRLTLSPDGNTLAYISRRSEANEPAHSLLALYDLRTMTLSFPAPSTGDDLSPAFSTDGTQLAWLRAPFTQVPEFAVNRVSANPWSIELLDLTTHVTRTVFTPDANKPGSVLPHMATGEPPLFFVPATTLSSGREAAHSAAAVERPAVTATSLIFASEADGWVHLYALDLAQPSAPRLLTPDSYEVEEPVVSADGTVLLYSSNDIGGHEDAILFGQGGSPGVRIPAKQMVIPTDSDRRHIWTLDAELSRSEMPWRLTEDKTYGAHDVVQYRMEMHPAISGKTSAALLSDGVTPLYPATIGPYAGSPAIPLRTPDEKSRRHAEALIYPTQTTFDSSDGLHVHGQLFLPKPTADSSAALRNDKQGGNDKQRGNDKRDGKQGAEVETKHPAIIYLHGGPHRQELLGYPSGEYYSNAYDMNQYLASRGFIVLSVNYRGSIGYGLDFRQCVHCGPDGAAEYADVLAAQRYLASRPDVDAKRIGLWGGSYGGYLTALALARNSDLFAAGVDFHGVHDWNLEDNAADWKQGSFAQQDAIAAKALASSPLGDIGRWTSPILLIHGDNDPDVAYAQTPILADKLRAQKTPVEELIFPDETHNFLLHKDWLAAYTAAAAFFERVLKP